MRGGDEDRPRACRPDAFDRRVVEVREEEDRLVPGGVRAQGLDQARHEGALGLEKEPLVLGGGGSDVHRLGQSVEGLEVALAGRERSEGSRTPRSSILPPRTPIAR